MSQIGHISSPPEDFGGSVIIWYYRDHWFLLILKNFTYSKISNTGIWEYYYFSDKTTLLMAKLKCSDYGFECEFAIAEGEIENVIVEFGKHTLDEHGIEYSKEALMQFILRKG